MLSTDCWRRSPSDHEVLSLYDKHMADTLAKQVTQTSKQVTCTSEEGTAPEAES